jgi:preprotein translocase SecE subunit
VASTKKTSTSTAKVTRIKATDTAQPPRKAATKAAAAKKTASTSRRSTPAIFKPFIAIGRYFKGAWVELKQVRWPTRGATWGLTGAVLAFTAFFVALILLLDAAFKFLFETILK